MTDERRCDNFTIVGKSCNIIFRLLFVSELSVCYDTFEN